MTGRHNRALSWIVVALFASASAPASAQTGGGGAPDGRPEGAPSAQDLYVAAQRLFDKGSYADALVAFRNAYSASGSPNARIMIGNCLIALGRTADAYEEMSATMREAARRAESEPKYAPTRDAAAAQIALLESKVGKLVIVVAGEAGAEVTVNGSRVPPDRLGVPFAVDPGAAVLAATLADGRSERREITVRAGEIERVTLTFAEAARKKGEGDGEGAGAARPESAKPAGSGREPAGRDEARTGGGVRTAGFVVAGLGVAGMAVFAVTGAMARSRFSTLEDECRSARCTDLKYADDVDTGMALTTAANVGLIVGAAGLVGGGLMVLLGGPSSAPQAARSGASRAAALSPRRPFVGAGVAVSPGGAGVRCTVAF